MNSASFLPEDYLEQKAERRTNVICLTLFAVVMVAVFGAFLVTNRQWTQVRAAQHSINGAYQEAAMQIEQLTELETQREQMLHKAELAASLVERVPRSILLADLINRMPPRLSLIEFTLTSEKIVVTSKNPVQTGGTGRLGSGKPQRAPTKEDVVEQSRRIEPTRYMARVTMTGVAPTDLEVSRYMAELNAYSLLHNVALEYSEEHEIEGQKMRQFRIKFTLDPDADVREIQPLMKKRSIHNPMADELRFAPKLGGVARPQPRTAAGE
jgi:Tfp pilus assembly protein PilN